MVVKIVAHCTCHCHLHLASAFVTRMYDYTSATRRCEALLTHLDNGRYNKQACSESQEVCRRRLSAKDRIQSQGGAIWNLWIIK